MTRGGKIARDVHYIVVRLSTIMGPDKIAFCTGIFKAICPADTQLFCFVWYC